MEEVRSEISRLDINKSAGPSKITAELLKKTSESSTSLLYKFISSFFNTSVIPACLKKSKLIPISKKGDRKQVNNYRGISIQSAVSKVFDKIITRKLQEALLKIIPEEQHGFVRGRSTTSNLIETTSFIHEAIRSKCPVDIIYFDITKTFITKTTS